MSRYGGTNLKNRRPALHQNRDGEKARGAGSLHHGQTDVIVNVLYIKID
jgi:hypothetical protein